MCSAYCQAKGLIPKAGVARFRWCISVITLALLGSRWKVAPGILFPLCGPWNEFRPDGSKGGSKLWGGEQTVGSLDSLKLPSNGATTRRNPKLLLNLTSALERETGTVLMNDDLSVTETLYLAVTLTPPKLNEDFLNTFKFHYDRPAYHGLRLVRVSRITEIDQVVDMYLVVCDTQEFRSALKDRFISRSFSDDGSPRKLEAISHGNSPISLVRAFKQYVIERLCHNLDCLKINLEEAVRTPVLVYSIRLKS